MEAWYFTKHRWAAIFAELGAYDKAGYDPDLQKKYANQPVGLIFSEIVRRMDKAKVERQRQKDQEKARKTRRR